LLQQDVHGIPGLYLPSPEIPKEKNMKTAFCIALPSEIPKEKNIKTAFCIALPSGGEVIVKRPSDTSLSETFF
jgi:hypothetical protein